MNIDDWSTFWKKPNNAFNAVMKVSTDFFYNELAERYPLKKGERVLDYGCGPGFLIRNLVASNVEVTGADINDFFLDLNKKNFPESDFIKISEDPARTAGVLSKEIPNRKFDRIILLSIVQYFKSAQDVEDVVKFLKDYLKPGGQLIIADVLDERTSSVRDAVGAFIQCARKGRVLAFARFILYLLGSDYRKLSAKRKLLFLSNDIMKHLAESCSLSFTVSKEMTPHPTRSNYIFSH